MVRTVIKADLMARITVQVKPNASSNAVEHLENGTIYVRIKAPPVRGRANSELIRFLSELLGVPKSGIAVLKGATSRRKVISVDGITEQEVIERIEKY
jgi:uncharacterized protein (TIGR00251 family)